MKQRGDLIVEFTPKTSKRLDYNPFLADPSLVNEIKKRMDDELRRKGINVRNSKMEPDPKTFGLRYQAEYDPPRRYGAVGAAIVATVRAVIKAVVQAIKAIVRLIVRAVKAIVKFIQKLIVKIQTLVQYFNEALKRWQPLAEGRQSGELDPENPEKGLNEMEKDVEGAKSGAFNFGSPWVFLGIGAVAVTLLMVMRK
jgi:hypothetical protein